jgi:hypothetical protein
MQARIPRAFTQVTNEPLNSAPTAEIEPNALLAWALFFGTSFIDSRHAIG